MTRDQLTALARAAVFYSAGAALLAIGCLACWWATAAIAGALIGYGVWWCWSRMFRWGRPW